jgi:5-methyltetrahydrofolate--homocysteine methyltransferase
VYEKWVDPVTEGPAFAVLNKLMKERILVIDGAMGTAVQKYKLTEEQFRGDRYKNHTKAGAHTRPLFSST